MLIIFINIIHIVYLYRCTYIIIIKKLNIYIHSELGLEGFSKIKPNFETIFLLIQI